MSTTQTKTTTFTSEDISKVIRSFTTELKMIASSTRGMTEAEAAKYGHDIEYLAQHSYLSLVDVTLYSNGKEENAVQYTVRDGTKDLTPSKPGGVMWRRLENPKLHVTVRLTIAYTPQVEQAVKAKLYINWQTTNFDLSHPNLKKKDGRDFTSNGYGISRTDFE
ncbi:hypothetical protein RM530_14600 [Algiphilus sp. W345]|uniref:Bacterial HORMA domain-containing protein n=1 Tax=Banduia mediterranea TaxID=3075609 RepID=A0ABU2WL08_9GAMM|nr:hypothetical protein [Algiphilus sp. W345]MDT0498578.1 hypothetical protein [Algiphilus sp. W345]